MRPWTPSRLPDDHAESVRRNAPPNNVSARITLCVFASTFLTALVVSWLSIGAIHNNDVRARIGQRSDLLLEDRADQIEAWYSTASAQLAAAELRSPSPSSLVAALDAHPASSDLHWISRASLDRKSTGGPGCR